MQLTASCRNCGQAFDVAAHLAGHTVACPACHGPMEIPPAPTIPTLPSAMRGAGGGPGARPGFPPPGNPQVKRPGSSSNRQTVILVASILGGLVVLGLLGFLGLLLLVSGDRSQYTQHDNLLEARQGFRTRLRRHERAGYPVPRPPTRLLTVEHYPTSVGPLAAYVSPSPGDGRRHPAIIWIFGGFDNSIGEAAWEPASPDNDQSARAFREAGILMMYPSLRGGNTNPGSIEGFYGEVDDVLAAAEYLAAKDYVDPNRIYLGGHSTGGTLAMLAAASSDRFRAVFAFGPVEDVAGYGPESLPFDTWNDKELALRAPINWLHAMHGPLFVFEGTAGNAGSLRLMQRASRNPQLHFHIVPGDHFSILAPVTRTVAAKVRADTGPTCNIRFSAGELPRF